MKQFKIEAAPSLPTQRPKKYPIDKLKVGESFFVPGLDHRKLRTRASQHGKLHGGKFSVRRDNQRNGYHVIRVE